MIQVAVAIIEIVVDVDVGQDKNGTQFICVSFFVILIV